MPSPRFGTQIRRTHPPIAARPGNPQGDQITTEIVEGPAVGLGNWYYIRGTATPTRAPLALKDGDYVSVLWQNAKPFMILNTQSPPGSGHDVPGGNDIVEDLFFANDSDGNLQVWFRNSVVLANLKLRGDWPADPDQVKWGARADSFFVRVGHKYFVYKITSRGGIDNPLLSTPATKLLRVEQPWDSQTVLATVTYDADITVDSPCGWRTDISFQDHDPPFTVHTTNTAAAVDTLSRGNSDTKVTEIKIQQAFVEGNTIIVMDASLDFKYNLVLSIQAKLGSLVDLPGTHVANIEYKTYGRTEQPVGTIISEDGDITALDHQCELEEQPRPASIDPDEDLPWQAPAPDDDWHSLVVNVTQGLVVWSSAKAAPAINWDGRITEGFGAEQHIESTVSLFPSTDNRLQVNGGMRNVAPFGAFSLTPPVDPLTPEFANVSLSTRGNGARNLLDAAGLAWLRLPGSLDPQTVTSTTIRYASLGNNFGQDGTQTDNSPDPGFHNVYLQTTTDDEHTARALKLLLYPVQFLPHRTKVGGDIYLFVVGVFLNDGAFVSQQYSFWKYTTDTGKAVTLKDWTVETNDTNFFEVDIIGASLRHVLWTLKRGHFSLRWTIMLSDSLTGNTKILVDETAADFVAPGPQADAFLKRNWKLPRPDLLYLLDDKDNTGKETGFSNQFLIGWQGATVTLDPAKLVIDGTLASKAKLKTLPASVVPDSTQPPITFSQIEKNRSASVRVLEDRESLESKFIDDP